MNDERLKKLLTPSDETADSLRLKLAQCESARGDTITYLHEARDKVAHLRATSRLEIARLKDALLTIGVECENYTGPSTCIDDPSRTRGSKYSAEAWCDGCVARSVLVIRADNTYCQHEGCSCTVGQSDLSGRWWHICEEYEHNHDHSAKPITATGRVNTSENEWIQTEDGVWTRGPWTIKHTPIITPPNSLDLLWGDEMVDSDMSGDVERLKRSAVLFERFAAIKLVEP